MSQVSAETSAPPTRLAPPPHSSRRGGKAMFAKERHAGLVKKMKANARNKPPLHVEDTSFSKLQHDISAEVSMEQTVASPRVESRFDLDKYSVPFQSDLDPVVSQTSPSNKKIHHVFRQPFDTEDNTLTTFEGDGISHNEDPDTTAEGDNGCIHQLNSLADLDVSFESYTNSEYDSSYDVDTPEDEYAAIENAVAVAKTAATVAAAAAVVVVEHDEVESLSYTDYTDESESYTSFHKTMEGHNVSALYDDDRSEVDERDDALQCVYSTLGSTVGELFEFCIMGEDADIKTERDIERVRQSRKVQSRQREQPLRRSRRKVSDASDQTGSTQESYRLTRFQDQGVSTLTMVTPSEPEAAEAVHGEAQSATEGAFPDEASSVEVSLGEESTAEVAPVQASQQSPARRLVDVDAEAQPPFSASPVRSSSPASEISTPSSEASPNTLSRQQRLQVAREMQQKRFGGYSPGSSPAKSPNELRKEREAARAASPSQVYSGSQWEHFSPLSLEELAKQQQHHQKAKQNQKRDDPTPFDEAIDISGTGSCMDHFMPAGAPSDDDLRDLTTSSLALDVSAIKHSHSDDEVDPSSPPNEWTSFDSKIEPDTPRTTNRSVDASQNVVPGSIWSSPSASYNYETPPTKSAPQKSQNMSQSFIAESGAIRKQLFEESDQGKQEVKKVDESVATVVTAGMSEVTASTFESPPSKTAKVVTPQAPKRCANASMDQEASSLFTAELSADNWETFSNDAFQEAMHPGDATGAFPTF